jgi:hypothetical protein
MGNTDYFPLDPDYTLGEGFSDGVLRSQSMGRTDFQRLVAPPLRSFKLYFNGRSSAEKAQLQQFYREMEASWFVFNHPAYMITGEPPAYLERAFPVRFAAPPSFELSAYESWGMEADLVEAAGCALAIEDCPDPDDGHPTATIIGTVSGSDMIFIYAGYGFVYTGTGTLALDGVSVTSPLLTVPLGLHRLVVTGGSGTLEAVI